MLSQICARMLLTGEEAVLEGLTPVYYTRNARYGGAASP